MSNLSDLDEVEVRYIAAGEQVMVPLPSGIYSVVADEPCYELILCGKLITVTESMLARAREEKVGL
jgi:hypothetical protein